MPSPTFYTTSFMNSKWVNKWLHWYGSNPLGILHRADTGGQKPLQFFYNIILPLPNPYLSTGCLFCGFSLRPKLYGNRNLSWSTNVTKHSHLLSNITGSDLLKKSSAGKPSLSKFILSYLMSTEWEGKKAKESTCILETQMMIQTGQHLQAWTSKARSRNYLVEHMEPICPSRQWVPAALLHLMTGWAQHTWNSQNSATHMSMYLHVDFGNCVQKPWSPALLPPYAVSFHLHFIRLKNQTGKTTLHRDSAHPAVFLPCATPHHRVT